MEHVVVRNLDIVQGASSPLLKAHILELRSLEENGGRSKAHSTYKAKL